MGQNLVPLVNIKIAGKWMFIPLKMVYIGIDPTPNQLKLLLSGHTFQDKPFQPIPTFRSIPVALTLIQ
jgi:hypothetical protein